jgi:dienelactone hydrolase
MIANACRVVSLVVAVLVVWSPAGAQERKPGPINQPFGTYREQEFLIPWERNNTRWLAHAKIFRPEGEAPRPLILIAHGRARLATDHARQRPNWADVQARWFAAQGFVVIVPMRRGYGLSDGPTQEGSGPCESPNYLNAAQTTANDVQGVLGYMSAQPYVDGTKVVVVGQSVGGWGTLAVASRNPNGVLGVINFAGGHGNTSAGTVCTADRLVEGAATLGKTAKVPALWVYTTNDKFFNDVLSAKMHAAYAGSGAPADYKLVGAFGADGHSLFADPTGLSTWTPVVTQFLRKLELMR